MDTCGLTLSLVALFKAGHAISDTFEISRTVSYTSSTLHSRPSRTLFPSLPTLPFNSYRREAGLAHVSDCIRLIIGKQIANTYSADTHTHVYLLPLPSPPKRSTTAKYTIYLVNQHRV